MSGAAKTVSFSPLRAKQPSVKISLDAPYQLKWPHVPVETAEILLEELKRSLSGIKELLSAKVKERSSSVGKRKRKRKSKQSQSGECVEMADDPSSKRICQESSNDVATPPHSDESAEATQPLHSSGKRSQLVIGTNALTRCLEQGTLRVGVVCLTARPVLLHKHLLHLSATRCVPMAALPNLSPTIAPLLGLKSCLAIGVKKVGEEEVDCYSELVGMVTSHAPPISIPWLTSDPLKVVEDTSDTMSYVELNIKRTVSRPKTKGNK